MEKLTQEQLESVKDSVVYISESEVMLYGYNIADLHDYNYMVSNNTELTGAKKHKELIKHAKHLAELERKRTIVNAIKSKQDIELPSYFGKPTEIPIRYYPLNAEMSSFNVYTLTDKETNTYELKIKNFTLTPSGDSLSLLISDKENSARGYFTGVYSNYIDCCEDPTKAMPLQDFFLKAIHRELPLCSDLILTTEPEALADDPTVPNLAFFAGQDYSSLDKGKLEVWLDWLNKIETKEHAKIFMEWVGGIFDHQNKSRNILFLVGGGATAKSVAMNAIYTALGELMPSGVASIDTENGDRRWLTSVALGKRFLMCSDSSDLHILNNSVIKTISGNDITKVEFKGKSEFSARMYSRIAVIANQTPYCSYRNVHESSRYLLVPIKYVRSEKYESTSSSEYARLLQDGAGEFLKLCYIYYTKANRPSDFCDVGSFAYDYAKAITLDLDSTSADKFIEANCSLGMHEGYFVNKNALVSFLGKFFEAKYRSQSNITRLVHETLPLICKTQGVKEVRLNNGDVVLVGIKINNPRAITTLEEIYSGADVKETLYRLTVEDIPSILDNDTIRVLSSNAYSRHIE